MASCYKSFTTQTARWTLAKESTPFRFFEKTSQVYLSGERERCAGCGHECEGQHLTYDLASILHPEHVDKVQWEIFELKLKDYISIILHEPNSLSSYLSVCIPGTTLEAARPYAQLDRTKRSVEPNAYRLLAVLRSMSNSVPTKSICFSRPAHTSQLCLSLAVQRYQRFSLQIWAVIAYAIATSMVSAAI